MFEKFFFRSLAAVAAAALLASTAEAVTIDLVPVGNPGNDNDPETGYGRVLDPYLIGKYEVTNGQWREFLTAKASVTDAHGLYNTDMAKTFGGIDRTWSVDHYVYTAKGDDANWDDRPVNHVSFWDAARFCNWLHNGQGDGGTETGAYVILDDFDTSGRQPGAKYFIPTEDEWYKSAYYDPDKGGVGIPGYWDYPMMSDIPTVPSNDLTTPDEGNNANFYQDGHTIDRPYLVTIVGEFELSESPYGTFDQGGNLWEWNETVISERYRGLRGGSWNSGGSLPLPLRAFYYDFRYPPAESHLIGFRVASVPEPGSLALLICGAVAGLIWWRRKE